VFILDSLHCHVSFAKDTSINRTVSCVKEPHKNTSLFQKSPTKIRLFCKKGRDNAGSRVLILDSLHYIVSFAKGVSTIKSLSCVKKPHKSICFFCKRDAGVEYCLILDSLRCLVSFAKGLFTNRSVSCGKESHQNTSLLQKRRD